MTVDDVLRRFDGTKPAGDGWQARCPAHEDRKASLSITSTHDKVLVHCHAGCDPEAIVGAVGLTLHDLFLNGNGHRASKATILETYDYEDEAGRLLYQAVRFDPKDFRQRRPDGHGGWTWDLKGVRRVLYRLPQLQGRKTVTVVEGERDVATAVKWDLPATCNAMGAGKWSEDYTAQLKAAGVERVVIVPDNDQPGRRHAEAVARSCHAAGLTVKVVTLPTGKDLTDYAQSGATKASFTTLVKAAPVYAPEPEAPEAPADDLGLPVMPPPNEPMPVARAIITSRYRHQAGVTLLFHRGEFYGWTGRCWQETDARDVRRAVYEALEHAVYIHPKDESRVPWSPSRRKVDDVLDALRAAALLDTASEAPCWTTGGSARPPASEIVALTNGLLHVPTRRLLDHTPEFFGHHSLPFDFAPDAPSPERWLAFLHQLWPSDPASIACLQEWLGYLIAGDTSLQKIFLLVGPKRGGKGTIARVVTGLLGQHHVAGPTLAGLGTNFGLSPLLGKPLAIVSDARLSSRADAKVVVERLLSISGEDSLTIDRKFKEPWTGRLPTRFLILSNELPRLADASGALASRFVVMVLTESFLGRENPRLTSELLSEASGIFNWSLEGYDRLMARGYFEPPASGAEAVQQLEDLSSPVSAFLRDRCLVGPSYTVSANTLWKAWSDWCSDGNGHPGTKAIFGRDLRAAVPMVRKHRPRAGEGEREHAYSGVTLRDGANQHVDPRREDDDAARF